MQPELLGFTSHVACTMNVHRQNSRAGRGPWPAPCLAQCGQAWVPAFESQHWYCLGTGHSAPATFAKWFWPEQGCSRLGASAIGQQSGRTLDKLPAGSLLSQDAAATPPKDFFVCGPHILCPKHHSLSLGMKSPLFIGCGCLVGSRALSRASCNFLKATAHSTTW